MLQANLLQNRLAANKKVKPAKGSTQKKKLATHPIEQNFPFLELDKVAEQESWRKEIYRPIYHIHKWWAQRLGSVFRAILIGCLSKNDADIWKNFYQINNFKDSIILDPFMGSGTTIGEAIKLGAKAIGCDINPVSTFAVTQALQKCSFDDLHHEYHNIEADVKEDIQQYFKTLDPQTKEERDVLYFFWVKTVITPGGEEIPLFTNYVFSRNAYPSKKPESKILCPKCGEINTGLYNSTEFVCKECKHNFNPQSGPASGQWVTDSLDQKYKIKDLIAKTGNPPNHRLYAIMARSKNGERLYIKPERYDIELFEKASIRLQNEELPLPNLKLRDGYNTSQAMGYNYTNWRHFFNDRQLLCLGLLLKRILHIENPIIREQFVCLFSSTLEFNNLFCSFKGEGTGAVRHMFSHHVLKPEKMPLESSVWGIERTSGTFSSLFKSRLLKAKEYLDCPFEIFVDSSKPKTKVEKRLCNRAINVDIVNSWSDFEGKNNAALLLNGDSSRLDIPNESIDAVVTDPPYFDFVHYSELSDFFYAWLAPALKDTHAYLSFKHSGSEGEVQDRCPRKFSQGLQKVFQECWRVLVKDGVLVFSFHHSHPEGWLAIYNAVTKAGFSIVAAHPVKAEMSSGSPKNQTKTPINLDAILVCKKSPSRKMEDVSILDSALENKGVSLNAFKETKRALSSADEKVILASQILVVGSQHNVDEKNLKSLLEEVFDK